MKERGFTQHHFSSRKSGAGFMGLAMLLLGALLIGFLVIKSLGSTNLGVAKEAGTEAASTTVNGSLQAIDQAKSIKAKVEANSNYQGVLDD